jgi:aminomethyltransferase
MPVAFDGIQAEHAAVRERAGVFDVSHMGQVFVAGPDATSLMQQLTTNDVSALEPGEGQYAAITREDGVMIDDTVVYALPSAEEHEYLFVPNAGHEEQLTARWRDYAAAQDLEARVENRTAEFGMIALQGPEAVEWLEPFVATDPDSIHRFGVVADAIAGEEVLIARTGYTGEDGFELVCPWDATEPIWDHLDCQACGLGARDTLRLEMGYLLSGQDFHPESEPRTPFEAGLDFVVDLDSTFVGRDAIADQAGGNTAECLVGIQLSERGVPRQGYDIESPAGDPLGTVTSGTMSPTLSEPIALGYVSRSHAAPDTEVTVRIRGEPKKGRIREPPFVQP